MNNLQLIKSADFGGTTCDIYKSADCKTYGEGYIYAIEFGNSIKVGKTQDPKQRICALKRTASYAQVDVGDLLLSVRHTNFSENENVLHSALQNRIIGTELFNVSLEDAAKHMENLNFVCLSKNNKTEKLKAKERKKSQIAESAKLFATSIIGDDEEAFLKVPLSALTESHRKLEDVQIETLLLLETVAKIKEPERGGVV